MAYDTIDTMGVPGYISVIMWRGMLNRFGWVNVILTSDIDYLGLDNWAKFSVIFVNIWMGFSFMTMTTVWSIGRHTQRHVRGG